MQVSSLPFRDVLIFAAGYWRRKSGRISLILKLFITAALLEACLPTLLSDFLSAIRLNKGRLVEEGAHTALMQKENGLYADLFKLQSGGFLVGMTSAKGFQRGWTL